MPLIRSQFDPTAPFGPLNTLISQIRPYPPVVSRQDCLGFCPQFKRVGLVDFAATLRSIVKAFLYGLAIGLVAIAL